MTPFRTILFAPAGGPRGDRTLVKMLRRFTRTNVRAVDVRFADMTKVQIPNMSSRQWTDDPRYPADEANLALRPGVDVVMYAMTH